MFETSGPRLSQKYFPFKSSAIRSCGNAPENIRQHEVLPAFKNHCGISVNLGSKEFDIPGWSGEGIANEGNDLGRNSTLYSQTPRCTPDVSPLEQIPQQRKFLVFDHSGNETRLFSSLCPEVQNLWPMWNTDMTSAKELDASKFIHERLAREAQQVCINTPKLYEESGENEIFDDGCEMHEDTEEINALLYSEDDNDQDSDFYDQDEDGDEVNSGHFPLFAERVRQKQEERQKSALDDEVAVSSISLKRCKTINGGHEELALINTVMTGNRDVAYVNTLSEDFSSAIDKGTDSIIRSKRPRQDKTHDTMKVLESILPGLKNKDPVAVLDEAISYLQCLKNNAEIMSAEDSSSSGCYEPSLY